MPQPLSRALRLTSIFRLVLFCLAVPCVYLGGAGLAFTMRLRAANASYTSLRMPYMPEPTASTRLMVFAPHCDDETLGCGGLIQQTISTGGKAQAVIITNGDGFRTAVECAAHTMRIGPGDYVRFAAQRQQESYRALAVLGMKHDDVRFLGYPDRGLLTLWTRKWTPDSLFISPTTRCDRSPYPNTYHTKATYCGQSLLDDIKNTLRAFHPTLVTVTHPSEDHIDHVGASAFVTRALLELQSDPLEARWARHTRLTYYLIHRGDWPQPQGLNPSAPLAPPANMAHIDTHWTSLPLTAAQTAAKARSIDCYGSQTAMMGPFLRSFARSTEIYGEITQASLASVPSVDAPKSASDKTWQTIQPTLLDPVRDNLLRDLNGGGDIRALYVCRDLKHLYIRLDCRRPITSQINYLAEIRVFGTHGETESKATVFQLSSGRDRFAKTGLTIGSQGCSLQATIPWSEIEAGCDSAPVHVLGIDAETTLSGVEVDRTGVRFLNCTLIEPHI